MKKKVVGQKDFHYKVMEFQDALNNTALFERLKYLTLHSYSGMSRELRQLKQLSMTRKPKCKVIVCSHKPFETVPNPAFVIAWALLSSEESDFRFCHGYYKPDDGKLFEVFVQEDWRRKGIGSNLIKIAKKHCGRCKICICPWDYTSGQFFSNFEKYQHQKNVTTKIAVI